MIRMEETNWFSGEIETCSMFMWNDLGYDFISESDWSSRTGGKWLQWNFILIRENFQQLLYSADELLADETKRGVFTNYFWFGIFLFDI